MAATTAINAQSLTPGASTSATFALTPPCTGVSAELIQSGGAPLVGCTLVAQTSVDGTDFSEPQRVAEISPAVGYTSASKQVFVSAQNCASVKFTIINQDGKATVTASLSLIQV